MLLPREKADRMRAAVETDTKQAIETVVGSCIAEDDENGDEWEYEWHDGEARIFQENEETGQVTEYVFAIRVELVAVEPM